MTSFVMTASELRSGSLPMELTLILFSLLVVLAISFWAAKRTIALFTLLADLNQEVEYIGRRTIYIHFALEMLAREVSEHLNDTHSQDEGHTP